MRAFISQTRATAGLLLLAFSICCFVNPLKISAQQPQSQSQLSETRAGVDENNPINLSIDDAIKLALKNNSDIEVERINLQRADNDLIVARSKFDPDFNFSQLFARQAVPVTSSLGGSSGGAVTISSFKNDFGIKGLLSTGGDYEFSANASRYSSSNFFSTIDPQINTEISLTFRQPLLRNRKTDDVRHGIYVAKRSLDISDSEFRQRVIEIIVQVEQAYWDLVFAKDKVSVARDSIKLADLQLDQTNLLLKAGHAAPVDIIQIDAQIHLRQEDLLEALEDVNIAENSLKVLILADRSAPEWQSPIIPTDKPEVKSLNLELNSLLSTALSTRLELKKLDVRDDLAGENISFYRNQTKPQLDLIATYSLQGLAGSLINRDNPTTDFEIAALQRLNLFSRIFNLPLLTPPPVGSVPGFLQGGTGQSLQNLFQNKFYTFQFGVQLKFPLHNRLANAKLAQAKLDKQKAEVERKHTENLIEREVRNAYQSVLTWQERVDAAHAACVAEESQLKAEQARYRAGMSTNFLVLTRQQGLIEARSRELRAITNYSKALSDLQRVTGLTLTTHSVNIAP